MGNWKTKPSGIEWIGEIPAHWKVIKVKHKYNFETGFTPDTQHQEYYSDESGYEWATIADINNGIVSKPTKSLISRDFVRTHHKHPVSKGCLLYSFKLSVGQVAVVDRPIFTNEAIAAFYPSEECNLNFFKYSSFLIEYNSNTNIYGAKILNQELINNAYIVFPPLKEQVEIADFLDTKCSEIDTLVTNIQSQVDILEQYKRSIIAKTVTKGLNHTVEMKDSGIEWVGKIPKHWDVHPVFHYFGERKVKNSTLKEQNLLSLSYGKIIRKDIDTLGGLLPASFNTYNIVEADDIIIRPTDLQNDKRSLRTGLVTERGIITSAYIDLMPKAGVNSKYFHYLLHSYDVMKVFYNMGNGVRQGLNYSEFAKLMIFAPPSQEQQDIVDYLDGKCEEINTIIADKKQQLETLANHKKSLIYEYVTGKKQVKENA